MTFGIDVSGYQAGMDFVRAKSEGVEFVIVKAVAANQPAHAVADGYRAHVDAVTAAGLPKGHYLVVNSRNTPEQSAEFLVANLHGYTPGDVIALDNEPLDGYPTFWSDAECARFFTRVHELNGHPYDRMWLYCPASLTRANQPWSSVAALGVRFWWVAYGGEPTGQIPDHEPSLQGSIPRWDVHQFTSRSRVAGRDVDGNYSPHPVNELFGGGAVVNEAAVVNWIRGYPRKWDQLCQALMWQLANRFGTVVSTPESAILAYHVEKSAGRIRTDTPAPPGSFVYWDIGRYGHVGFVLNGGRVLMATRHLITELVADDAGIQTVAGYSRATGADYLGWSWRNGGNSVPFTADGSAPAGGRSPIAVANVLKGNMMEIYVSAPSGKVVHVFGGGKHNFDTTAEYNAWRSEVIRYKEKGWMRPDVMVPPALESLEKLKTWAEFERICKNFGAPVN